jgi:hypothetical protein
MQIQIADSLFLPKVREPEKANTRDGTGQSFADILEKTGAQRNTRVRIGTIDDDNPTVGHLLVDHPDYAEKCWDIVHSSANADKPYTRMAAGTPVFMDPVTKEISWPQNGGAEKTALDCSHATPHMEASGRMQAIEASIYRATETHSLPAGLIRAVIRAESAFEPSAVSHAGAQGLMQLMPATARELGVSNPFDIEQNIDGGARYLKQMLDLFGGDIEKALAAYNAGPGAVKRSQGGIPYQETRTYVARVISYMKSS